MFISFVCLVESNLTYIFLKKGRLTLKPMSAIKKKGVPETPSPTQNIFTPGANDVVFERIKTRKKRGSKQCKQE